ncbi:MAG: phage regulatory CII family protein [Janthinobacterium lividum]
MTCRYSGSHWLDVLYTSVRHTPGGVAAAATFLTTRRGRSIGAETLRLRLRGEGDNRLSMEMFELLLEWMCEMKQDHANDALHCLNEQFGLIAAPGVVDAKADCVTALTHAACEVQADVGDISRIVAESVVDKMIHADELARIEGASKAAQRSIQRLTETSRYLHHRHRVRK